MNKTEDRGRMGGESRDAADKRVAKRAKGTLTKDDVMREALRLIDEEGIDACSMRSLAARIGVTAMALYSYVPSRDALLDEACRAFLAGVEVRARPGEFWDDSLVRCMHGLRRSCILHPRLARLTIHPSVGRGLEPFMLRMRSLFLAQGMPEDVAVQLTVATDAFFAGFMLRAGQLVERRSDESSEGEGRDVALRHPADATNRLAVASRVPGLLTGRVREDAPVLNERWRRTLSAGYSAQSFENGLVIIIEGVRSCVGSDSCDWRTPS